jgi:hypothetical protein
MSKPLDIYDDLNPPERWFEPRWLPYVAEWDIDVIKALAWIMAPPRVPTFFQEPHVAQAVAAGIFSKALAREVGQL